MLVRKMEILREMEIEMGGRTWRWKWRGRCRDGEPKIAERMEIER